MRPRLLALGRGGDRGFGGAFARLLAAGECEQRVKSHLRDALDLPASDLDSAIVLVQSQLDLSLSRHLAE
jgi:hypothetical protein